VKLGGGERSVRGDWAQPQESQIQPHEAQAVPIMNCCLSTKSALIFQRASPLSSAWPPPPGPSVRRHSESKSTRLSCYLVDLVESLLRTRSFMRLAGGELRLKAGFPASSPLVSQACEVRD